MRMAARLAPIGSFLEVILSAFELELDADLTHSSTEWINKNAADGGCIALLDASSRARVRLASSIWACPQCLKGLQ